MSRSSTLILFGILIMLTPYSGLPIAFRTFLIVVFGACVAVFGFLLRKSDVRESKAAQEAPQAESASPEPPQGISPI